MKVKVGIIGAGGYGGCGAIEILSRHPYAEIKCLVDIQDTGRLISEIYPHLKGFCDLPIISPDDPVLENTDLDIVFFATPDGVGQSEAKRWLKRGVRIIDYSGDFRFNDPETYKSYAERIGKKEPHKSPELLKKAVYGLPELHREKIKKASIVGNPGCFAISCILGLAPAVKYKLIEFESIICDSKTGVSGAGKKPSPNFHYPARYDSMNAYKVAAHQHVFEIEKELSRLANKELKITFTPHVVPMCRGILSTIYANLKEGFTLDDVFDAYREFYKNERFIRLFEPGTLLQTAYVRGSNFCNICMEFDKRTRKLIILTAIDNLVKGQAGNAVQNMNIMFGIDEDAGLLFSGNYP